jgi:hypothetical protein
LRQSAANGGGGRRAFRFERPTNGNDSRPTATTRTESQRLATIATNRDRIAPNASGTPRASAEVVEDALDVLVLLEGVDELENLR